MVSRPVYCMICQQTGSLDRVDCLIKEAEWSTYGAHDGCLPVELCRYRVSISLSWSLAAFAKARTLFAARRLTYQVIADRTS
jgi:hypothetical protein